MNDKETFKKLAIGYLLIGSIINLASIMIDPYLTVLLDGLVIYLVFPMSLRLSGNYLMWTGLILGISCLISGFSALFLTMLCVINQSLLLCNRNPIIIGGLPFFFGMTIWIISSVVILVKNYKH